MANLTIDFNDASFDEASSDVQPVPNNVDIDVVFPISDDPGFAVAQADNRGSSASSKGVGSGPATSIALMPDQTTQGVMQEFLFEFENDIDPNSSSNNDQGLRITTEGKNGSGQSVIKQIDLQGTFENLHDGGTLDVYVHRGDIDHDNNASTAKIATFDKFSLGAPSSTSNSGDDVALLVSGDTNGANMGDNDDIAQINVDATADMSGLYQGGSGFDILNLIEGTLSDNGARVDFTQGVKIGNNTDVNSALVTNNGGSGSGLNFFMSEFETLELTNNADIIIIGGQTGHGLTNTYDAAYLNNGSDNSMLEVKSGYTDGNAADFMYVNASSNVYLSV